MEKAQGVQWFREPSAAYDFNRKWFNDGVTNICFNAVDIHAYSDSRHSPAIIFDSPVTNTVKQLSYWDLYLQVSRFAGVLASHGVSRGDRVVIYMPVIPEAAIAMLACTRIGAIHSVVFGGFAPHELASRIADAKPAAIVTASCGIDGAKVIPYKPIVDAAIELSGFAPKHTIVLQRGVRNVVADLKKTDVCYEDAMRQAKPQDCVPVPAPHPSYILYTSGTTSTPKGVVRDTGGHLVVWTPPL